MGKITRHNKPKAIPGVYWGSGINGNVVSTNQAAISRWAMAQKLESKQSISNLFEPMVEEFNAKVVNDDSAFFFKKYVKEFYNGEKMLSAIEYFCKEVGSRLKNENVKREAIERRCRLHIEKKMQRFGEELGKKMQLLQGPSTIEERIKVIAGMQKDTLRWITSLKNDAILIRDAKIGDDVGASFEALFPAIEEALPEKRD